MLGELLWPPSETDRGTTRRDSYNWEQFRACRLKMCRRCEGMPELDARHQSAARRQGAVMSLIPHRSHSASNVLQGRGWVSARTVVACLAVLVSAVEAQRVVVTAQESGYVELAVVTSVGLDGGFPFTEFTDDVLARVGTTMPTIFAANGTTNVSTTHRIVSVLPAMIGTPSIPLRRRARSDTRTRRDDLSTCAAVSCLSQSITCSSNVGCAAILAEAQQTGVVKYVALSPLFFLVNFCLRFFFWRCCGHGREKAVATPAASSSLCSHAPRKRCSRALPLTSRAYRTYSALRA